MKKHFGNTLKGLRKEKNWSQQALANKLFVSQDTISLWELGKSLPDFENIKKLAILFSVSSDYLIGLSDF